MDPPNYYPLSDKNSRKLSTTAHHTNNALSHPSATTASTPAAAATTTTTPQIARPRSLPENHRPNIISMPPTAASKTSYTPKKQPGKAAATHERRIINNNSLQQQQLPYNNMLLSGLNTSAILASESSSIKPLTTTAFFDTTTAAATTTTTTTTAAAAIAIPPRPRRLWKVLDTKIPKYPVLYYPPPNPYTSCILTDDTTTPPPSVIAIRIAECLLQRNVCVEYDEETATATVLTVDRCVMQIHLWRLSSTLSLSTSTHAATASSSSSSSTMTGAILVECIRTSGPVQTFHWTTQAVLQAAQGLDSGVDRRATRASRHRPYLATSSSSSSSSSSLLSSSSLEYVRYSDYDKKNENKNSTTTTSKAYNNDDGVEEDEQYDDDDDDDEYVSTLLPSRTNNNNNSTNNKNPDAMAATALETLEYAYSLITKDRLDAQQLGMEWLVSLTDIHAVGVDAALYHALALLGGMPMPMRTSSSLSSSPSLSSILYALIVDKQAPNEQQQHDDDDEEEEAESPTRQTEPLRRRRRVFRPGFPSFAASSNNDDDDDDDNDNDNNNNNSSESVYPYQDHHASFLRSMALRVLVNALTLLSKHQRTVLESLLLSSSSSSSSRHGNLWTSQDLIQALTDDLQGASRPPTAVLHGTGRLASCHEACLAIQCLGVLARHNVEAQRKILQNDATLTWLERARTVGRSTNMALYEQAEQVYTFLTETERSC